MRSGLKKVAPAVPPSCNVTVRWPPQLLAAVDGYASRTGQRRPTVIREAVVTYLVRAGAWPPPSSPAPATPETIPVVRSGDR